MSNVLFSIFPNERFVDLGLYQYGWEQCEPLHSYGPYNNKPENHYLFHYCISGTGTLISTDSKGESHTYQIVSWIGEEQWGRVPDLSQADQHLLCGQEPSMGVHLGGI